MKNLTLSEENFNKQWVTFWGNMQAVNLAERWDEEELKAQLKDAAGALSI